MAKLDDLFEKKKEAAPILDLSRATVNSKEEFRKLYDKVPDFKTRPERVRGDDTKIRDKDLTFKMSKRELKLLRDPYAMQDPIPSEMRTLKLDDLISVPIDWKMLTNLRPKTKLEEEYFSRMIELGKLELKTINREKREAMMTTVVRKTKNKAGVLEMRVVSCSECGEEFCNGKYCGDFTYECYTRVTVPAPGAVLSSKGVGAAVVAALKTTPAANFKGKSRRRKKKLVKRSRSKSVRRQKSSTTAPKPRSKSEGRKNAQKTKHKYKSGSKSE